MDHKPESSQTLSLDEIKKRLKSSFVSLTARQIALRAISFITINLILAKLLPVETLGIFNIATAIISFFAFFSDIGLAASLIQKKDEVSEEDIKTTFTIQQIIVGLLSLVIILGAPYFALVYNLDADGVWLIRVLGIAFFLSSLKVVPAVMLERNLRFSPLVFVEILETLVFNSLLIIFVFYGYSLWSFIVAALARGLVGVFAIYILAPVKIGFKFHKQSAKKLLSFGVPYQLNSILALLKDRLVPLVIARMIGPVGVGYITWAQALAFLPLEIMNVVIRITFPAFSRLQSDKETLGKMVEKSLFLTALITYPALFGIAALLPSVVTHVVSFKWSPAVPSFYLFAVTTYWAVISTTFTNTLNSIGKIKTTLKLMVMWTVLTWVLTPLLVYLTSSFIGVAVASFLISFSSVATVILIKRVLVVNVLSAVFLPTLSSFLMAGVVYFYASYFVRDKISIIPAVLLGVVFYSGFIYLFGKNKILDDLKSLKK